MFSVATGAPLGDLSAHPGFITDVAFSPDGSTIATVGHRTIKLWNASTRTPLRDWQINDIAIYSVAFSPDGTRLMTCGFYKVQVWDVESGREQYSILGEGGRAWLCVRFTRDGQRIAASNGKGQVKLWDAADGSPIMTINAHSNSVPKFEFSPDDARLLTASYDRTARLFDMASGQRLVTLHTSDRTVDSIAVSPDGSRIADSAGNQTLLLDSGTQARKPDSNK